jgi:exosome complex component RRP4
LLQTRNLKYGKLQNGFLVKVDSNFIKRGKIHIHDLGEEYGINVILGTNGYVWL